MSISEYCGWHMSPQRKQVRGDWRKLHNEELHGLYSSPDILLNEEIKVKIYFCDWLLSLVNSSRLAWHMKLRNAINRVFITRDARLRAERKHIKSLFAYGVWEHSRYILYLRIAIHNHNPWIPTHSKTE